MSVSCEAYIGYTVTLKENLDNEDFDFFWDFLEPHGEYNQYDCKGKVLLVTDGMNGEYARLVFVDEHIEECWIEGKDYLPLKSPSVIPDNVYEKLNKAYKAMYGGELDEGLIEYALWFQFG